MSFRNGRFTCGGTLLAAFGRVLCKGHLRFLSLHTAKAVHGVVFSAATALWLLQQGRTSPRFGSPTSDAPGCLSAFTMHVAEALEALEMLRAFSSHIRLHRHSHARQSVGQMASFYTGLCWLACSVIGWLVEQVALAL